MPRPLLQILAWNKIKQFCVQVNEDDRLLESQVFHFDILVVYFVFFFMVQITNRH